DRDGPALRLLRPHDEDVARAPMLCLSDALAHVGQRRLVEMNAEAMSLEGRRDAACVLERVLADRDDRGLLPVEPQGEVARVVLDETPDEALQAPEEDAVDHHRAL